jgi:L-asparaginase
LAAIPSLVDSDLEVAVTQFRQLAGSALDLHDLAGLSTLISKTVDEGVAGVVVTQGTDTIEETAFYLDVLHSSPVPVVVTGAMRNPTMLSADGAANLLAAIQVASSLNAVNLGCLVVMNDEVHAARFVRKTHANSTAAFSSPETGPLGRIVEDRLVINVTPSARIQLGLEPTAADPARVRLYVSTLGDDGAELDALAQSADGLVVAGFGGGHVHPAAVTRLEQISEVIPVVLTCRTGAGVALTSTYGFPGSESDLLRRGLISGGSLDPFKARILLGLLLSADSSRFDIVRSFKLFMPPSFDSVPIGDGRTFTIRS